MRLATRLVEVIMEPSDAAAGQFEEIMLSAEVDGWPLLSRLALQPADRDLAGHGCGTVAQLGRCRAVR